MLKWRGIWYAFWAFWKPDVKDLKMTNVFNEWKHFMGEMLGSEFDKKTY